MLATALSGCASFENWPVIYGSNPEKDSDPALGSKPDGQRKIKRLNLNLHIFGLSYHPDREGTRSSHLDNELNAGIGLNYKLNDDASSISSLEAGFFKDSGRNFAKFAGASYLFKLNDRWRVGVDLLILQSPTYSNGVAFIAPTPTLAYDLGVVKINAIYIPKVPDINSYDVLGIYLTIPLFLK